MVNQFYVVLLKKNNAMSDFTRASRWVKGSSASVWAGFHLIAWTRIGLGGRLVRRCLCWRLGPE